MEGILELRLPQQREVDGAVFPLVLGPSTNNGGEWNLVDWIRNHQDLLDGMLRKHRAIFFRGFGELKTHDDFHNAVEATGLNAMDYIGG